MLITAAWPVAGRLDSPADEDQAGAVADILELVSQIRNARADAGIEPATWLEAELRFEADDHRIAFEAIADVVARLARIRPVLRDKTVSRESGDALVVVSHGAEARLSVSAEDRERDRARLQKELSETERLLDATRAKLANDAFVNRAPADVVDGVRARESELSELAQRIREHLER
jgi:valyl-tRNA synthetase